eukprot:s2049_g11.t1
MASSMATPALGNCLMASSWGLMTFLQQWDFAVQLGTAQCLLIVSDACESGQMVEQAVLLGRADVAVQASCAGCNPTGDVVGETFTELLLWNLQGRDTVNDRGKQICDIERALLSSGPCYYCPARRNYEGWIFVDENGADQSPSRSFSLGSDSSETFSHRSHLAEPPQVYSHQSPTQQPQEEVGLTPQLLQFAGTLIQRLFCFEIPFRKRNVLIDPIQCLCAVGAFGGLLCLLRCEWMRGEIEQRLQDHIDHSNLLQQQCLQLKKLVTSALIDFKHLKTELVDFKEAIDIQRLAWRFLTGHFGEARLWPKGRRLELRLHRVGVLHGAAALGEGRHRWDAVGREAREPTAVLVVVELGLLWSVCLRLLVLDFNQREFNWLRLFQASSCRGATGSSWTVPEDVT